VKQLLQRETPDFITADGTDGLLTVLTLILWITEYVEYCSNVFIGNLLNTGR